MSNLHPTFQGLLEPFAPTTKPDPATAAEIANRHTLSTIAADLDALADFRFYAECACHNPDGYGDGRRDFFGPTATDVVDQWHDHFLATLAKAGVQ